MSTLSEQIAEAEAAAEKKNQRKKQKQSVTKHGRFVKDEADLDTPSM